MAENIEISDKKKIDNPRVFISYAWGDKQYQEKVLAFATQLVDDGIDVVIDKWDLTEGNETYAFMEKCANDETITNVLMLIDPIYAEKADSHKGGVGTETQIISPKVYQEVTQDKFIPIVFERDKDGNICKPTYLQGRLHFDLSVPENYDEEYFRLVKKLYGEPVYPKPKLGNKPSWVEKTESISVKKRFSFDSLKTIQPDKARTRKYSEYLSDSLKKIKDILVGTNHISSVDDVIPFYEKFREIRTEYNALLGYSDYIIGVEEIVARNLEEIALQVMNDSSTESGLAKNFIHELFLYTIAHFMMCNDYDTIGYILGRTYFNPSKYEKNVSSYDIFYSGGHNSLDQAMNKRDGKKYISGTATYWIENIEIECCTKEMIMLADLICYNYSVYAKDCLIDWFWFPMTYLYDNEYSSVLAGMGKRLISRSYVESLLPLFGYDTVYEFKNKLEEVSERIKNREYREVRYSEIWHSAALLNMFIDTDIIATVR